MHHQIIVAPDRVPADALRMRVIHVGDGDGFRTRIIHRSGHEEKAILRFGFIDAPELSQRGGPEARDYLKQLIDGKILDVALINQTGTGDCFDRYGRIVGVPFLTEASEPPPAVNPARKVFGQRKAIVRNIELEMVLNGWAWVLDRYGPHGGYRNAQQEARRLRRGIWAYDSNLAPWEYKKREREGRITEDRFLAEPRQAAIPKTSADCPRHGCSGQVKLRSGKRGLFWGCTNFPECKYTRNQ